MHTKLARVYKKTVEGEFENKKMKTKMASARKPEAFVWTVNEVELLLLLRSHPHENALLHFHGLIWI